MTVCDDRLVLGRVCGRLHLDSWDQEEFRVWTVLFIFYFGTFVFSVELVSVPPGFNFVPLLPRRRREGVCATSVSSPLPQTHIRSLISSLDVFLFTSCGLPKKHFQGSVLRRSLSSAVRNGVASPQIFIDFYCRGSGSGGGTNGARPLSPLLKAPSRGRRRCR